MAPTSVDSYRGYYEDLAIGVRLDVWAIAEDFRAMLDAAVGATMHGYKGGEYVMTRETRVWISNHGNVSSTLVTGARTDRKTDCVLITWEASDE